MDWPTVILGLGGSLIGALVALLVVGLQRRFAVLDREKAEASAFRDRSARIVGSLHALVGEASPTRLGVNLGAMTQPVLDDLWTRWRALREELVVLALVHPDDSVRATIDAVVPAVGESLTWTSIFVRDLSRDKGEDSKPFAEARFARASALVDLLANVTTGRETGNGVETRRAEIDREYEAAEAG
jgi:hypothetical protein